MAYPGSEGPKCVAVVHNVSLVNFNVKSRGTLRDLRAQCIY